MTSAEKRELEELIRRVVREELARARIGLQGPAPTPEAQRQAFRAWTAAVRLERRIRDEIRARGEKPHVNRYPELRAAAEDAHRLAQEWSAMIPDRPHDPEHEFLSQEHSAACEHRLRIRRALRATAKERGEPARLSLDPEYVAADKRVKELAAKLYR